MVRAWTAGILGIGLLAGCGAKKGGALVLTVSASSSLTTDQVSLAVSAGGRMKTFQASVPDGTLPPAIDYAIQIPPDALGAVSVTASAAGKVAMGDARVAAGEVVPLSLTLGEVVNDDMGENDLSGADLGATSTLSASPTQLQFFDVATNSQSAPVPVTITNNGADDTLPTLMNDNGVVFEIGGDTCSGALLTTGASCTFSVTFKPTSVGPNSATITLGTLSIPAAGMGVMPGALTSTPPAHGFGSLLLGSPAASQAFVIENTGAVSSGALSVGNWMGDAAQPCVSLAPVILRT